MWTRSPERPLGRGRLGQTGTRDPTRRRAAWRSATTREPNVFTARWAEGAARALLILSPGVPGEEAAGTPQAPRGIAPRSWALQRANRPFPARERRGALRRHLENAVTPAPPCTVLAMLLDHLESGPHPTPPSGGITQPPGGPRCIAKATWTGCHSNLLRRGTQNVLVGACSRRAVRAVPGARPLRGHTLLGAASGPPARPSRLLGPAQL